MFIKKLGICALFLSAAFLLFPLPSFAAESNPKLPIDMDQSDFVAYYFDNFYHINSVALSDALTYSLANTVPNYNNLGSATSRYAWATADVSSYSKAAAGALSYRILGRRK
jgi:hypothetical protein